MSEYVDYGAPGVVSREPARCSARQWDYVALDWCIVCAGAYVGRNLSSGLGHRLVHRRDRVPDRHAVHGATFGERTSGLLFGFGVLMGWRWRRRWPTTRTRTQALWQSGGATALFIAGFGAAGYATRRDLSALARICFFALIGLILFGIVLIFVNIPPRR